MGFWFSSMSCSISLAFLLCYFSFTSTEAYDKLVRNGNITIKWDMVSWSSDGYYSVVTLYNYQKYRDIKAPGWKLGWTWQKEELIWTIQGAEPTKQGDCSRFKRYIPQSCQKNPTVVDLTPDASPARRIVDCCKRGVLSSWGKGKDPRKALSSFAIRVGGAGTSKKTITVPKDFTLLAPGQKYTCGSVEVTESSEFTNWKITCIYFGKLATKLGS